MLGDLRKTGTSYSRLVEAGRIKPEAQTFKVRPAGTSNVCFDESVAIDMQSEVYFPVPPTPPELSRMRTDLRPGVGNPPRGPIPDIRHGLIGDQTSSVAQAFKAGQKSGMEEYLGDFAERNYSTVKKEPLGKPVDRGYDIPKGSVFGTSSNVNGTPLTSKEVIFPRGVEADNACMHKQYVKTHRSYEAGEQADREYSWPEGVNPDMFKFGKTDTRLKTSAKDALTWEHANDQTKVVLKRLEDYRGVSKEHLGERKNHMQLPLPVTADFRFGVRSTDNSNSAAHCLHFNVKVPAEVRTDSDVGKCEAIGKRNILSDRVYGLPSIRTDIPKPDFASRSVANVNNYGDDLGTASLLNPERFQNMGVPDEQFLETRSKPYMQDLLNGSGIHLDDKTFDKVWGACSSESVCIKDFLRTYGRVIVDKEVARGFN